MLTVVGAVWAQTTQVSETLTPEPAALTLAQLATAARAYLRDSAEFPLKMQLSMVAKDSSGRTIKSDHAAGTYDFHGYNPSSENASGNARLISGLFHSAKSLIPTFMNGFLASVLPSSILSKKDADNYSLEPAENSPSSQLVIARVRNLQCAEFKWSNQKTFPENFCGASQFALQKDDLSLQHFSFEAGGLPLRTEVKPFGRCEVLHYRAEVEFQKVKLPDDPKPFVVPKHVEVTVETDKGKLIMISDFAPRK
jgi:hypothetical protein